MSKVWKNWLEILLVLAIIIAAAFLRFYHLPEYMTFLGDEGRDALVVQKILVEHDLPFIGPPSSVGNIYLGPLYYYMMAVPMAVFWLNPAAASGMVAVVGVLTVLLIYYLARQWFGVWPAGLSSILYALSPVNIIQSRSSWNPNPAPFFALLLVLGFYQARRSRNFLWFALCGAALGAAIQMHYLALILIPVAAVLWFYELKDKRSKPDSRGFLRGTILGVGAFLFLMLPLVLFDLKHNFLNLRALFALFTPGGNSVSFNVLTGLVRVWPIYIDDLTGRYLAGNAGLLAYITAAVLLVPLVLLIRRARRGQESGWPYFALGVWLVVGLLGLSFYRGAIYDHYLGFLNPVPFLLFGSLAALIRRNVWRVGLGVLAVVLFAVSLLHSPLLAPPGNQLERTKEVAGFIINESGDKPFNFALIAKSNYDSAYQFYLGLLRHPPAVLPETPAGQLFVVCEDTVCNPIGHPKYEIAAFGWAKIEKVDDFAGVKVYKLVPNPSGKPS